MGTWAFVRVVYLKYLDLQSYSHSVLVSIIDWNNYSFNMQREFVSECVSV